MINIFSQPKVIYKIHFNIYYKNLELYEQFFELSILEILGTSSFELEFKEIEAKDDDLWRFEVYLGEQPNILLLLDHLNNFTKLQAIKLTTDDLYTEIIEDKDWVTEYQKQLKPITIGRFFIGSKSHDSNCPTNKSPIYLEASRAFGTGQHYTTHGCIEALEYLSNNNFNHILDVGTGSGILSFAAEYIWPHAQIFACDIDQIAVEIADLNKEVNGSKISFFQNKGTEFELSNKFGTNSYDLIISNILARPLINLADDFTKLTKQNTKFVLSGFLDSQMSEVFNKYHQIGCKVEKQFLRNRWVTLILSN